MSLSNSWRRSLATMMAMAAAAALGATLTAQPQHAPPPRVSADAASEELGGPTLVTVHAKDASPLDIMRQVTKEAGMGRVAST
ncbi:MAG: hypothetical protein FJ271_12605 [Planctomycetes bacterium]|nr:hypothetical protein [Planctomycetota bacterium]